MATYGIRVQAAVAASGSGAAIYTCPANSYAILNMGYQFVSGSAQIRVGNEITAVYSASLATPVQIVVGPGQSVELVNLSGTPGTVYLSGVEFSG